MAQLRRHVAALSSPDDQVVVTGDFNIAPTDIDVPDPKKMIGATHVSEPERAELAALCEWGLIDLFRQHHSDEKLYSWWDYRAGDFHQGRGMRIDLVLGTKSVAERCTFSVVDRNARKGQSPSDHAPVIADLS
jgi:exodeoxyribonuclease-3